MTLCSAFPTRRLLPLFLGLAAAMAGAAPAPRRFQVSVLPVRLRSDDRRVAGSASALIQEGVQDTLFQEGDFAIVERSDPAILGPILAELDFQNAGLVAPQEVLALGKLSGIQAFVVVGGSLSVSMFGSELSLRIQLIDVETSRLLWLFQVQVQSFR